MFVDVLILKCITVSGILWFRRLVYMWIPETNPTEGFANVWFTGFSQCQGSEGAAWEEQHSSVLFLHQHRGPEASLQHRVPGGVQDFKDERSSRGGAAPHSAAGTDAERRGNDEDGFLFQIYPHQRHPQPLPGP